MLNIVDYNEKNIVVCFSNNKQKISFQNDNLIIKDEEKNEIILKTTCHRIFSLWIIGNTNITNGIINKSKKFNFSIFLMKSNFKQYGSWNVSDVGNYLLREKQYTYKNFMLSKLIIKNKILNQKILLNSIRIKDENIKFAINRLDYTLNNFNQIKDDKSLLGTEGFCSKLFFKNWYSNWIGRKSRTKFDEINTLLDIGYTFLFNFIESILLIYGFDLYKGFFHTNFFQRKSLVCDIMEPFRSIIDNEIKKAYNLKQFSNDDFIRNKNQYFIKDLEKKKYVKVLVNALLNNKIEIFEYIKKYYRCFMLEKPVKTYPVFKILK